MLPAILLLVALPLAAFAYGLSRKVGKTRGLQVRHAIMWGLIGLLAGGIAYAIITGVKAAS